MKRKITGGLYLVVDPKPGIKSVLPKIKAALRGGVDIIQLWNNWNDVESPIEFVIEVCEVSHASNVPVLIHEHWSWLKSFPLDGVHFDTIPDNLHSIRQQIGRPFLTGVTCGNDQTAIDSAIASGFDYISFCSMFPSSTTSCCELVNPETIIRTRKKTPLPVFVAGGITRETIPRLRTLGIDGIAVVSGIMKAEDPEAAARTFKELMTQKINICL